MKNKLNALFARMEKQPVLRVLVSPFRWLYNLICVDFGLKLLAFVMAILLWNYVVTNQTGLMRTKSISGITATINRNSYSRLAMPNDPSEQLSDVSVMIEVSQSEFAYVSANNVQVTLDLSRVTGNGPQRVPLKATSTYGRVKKIIPDALTLTFEPKDSRVLPITTQFVGNVSEDLRYSVTSTNPSVLEISGATSLVNRVSRVLLEVDVTDIRQSATLNTHYKLLDSEGNEVDASMLDLSTSSVTVSLEANPQREIPICDDINRLVHGQPAEGYYVESIEFQPASLIVAADAEVLESVSELYIEPIDITDVSQSFSQKAKVSTLSSFRYVSADEVYIIVNIAEETVTQWVEDVDISFINKNSALAIERDETPIRVAVTGPRSLVELVCDEGLAAYIDLQGLGVGEQTAPLQFYDTNYSELEIKPEPETVRFTLSEKQPEADPSPTETPEE